MASIDSNNSNLPVFLLMGFFGPDVSTIWISIPPCLMYLLSILGNSLIVFIVRTDSQLGEPMYLLLAMLAATDLGMTLCTLPSVLGVFWFDFRNINFYVCMVQMFFVHMLSATGSAILVAMSFDRYIAICIPLRYASILHPMIAKIGLAALIRGVATMCPFPFFLNMLMFCDNKKLYHAFCYHPDVMNLACSDRSLTSTYGLVAVLLVFFLDSLFILCSYFMILKTVLSIASKDECLRALSTCVSHICVVLVFYMSLIGLTVAHRFAKITSPLLPLLMGLAHVFIPPVMNPMIYSMKTKQIRDALRKHLWGKPRRKPKVNQEEVEQNAITIN